MKRTISYKICVCLCSAALVLTACSQNKTPQTSATDAVPTESSTETATKETVSEETSTATTEETKAAETTQAEASTEVPSSASSEDDTEAAPETQPESLENPSPAQKSVHDIYDEITGSISLNSPMILPDEFISNYYDIDVNTLDEYVFSMSEAAISAETIAILKAKDANSTEALAAALQTVIDQKRSEMENYLPDQFQIVDKSSVRIEGNYVYLVISEQSEAIDQIILAGIR